MYASLILLVLTAGFGPAAPDTDVQGAIDGLLEGVRILREPHPCGNDPWADPFAAADRIRAPLRALAPRAIPALVAQLSSTSDSRSRAALIVALGEQGPTAGEALTALLRTAEDEDRAAILEALTTAGSAPPEALELLEGLLETRFFASALPALSTLEDLEPERRWATLLRATFTPVLRPTALRVAIQAIDRGSVQPGWLTTLLWRGGHLNEQDQTDLASSLLESVRVEQLSRAHGGPRLDPPAPHRGMVELLARLSNAPARAARQRSLRALQLLGPGAASVVPSLVHGVVTGAPGEACERLTTVAAIDPQVAVAFRPLVRGWIDRPPRGLDPVGAARALARLGFEREDRARIDRLVRADGVPCRTSAARHCVRNLDLLDYADSLARMYPSQGPAACR